MPVDYEIQPLNFTKYLINDFFRSYDVVNEEDKKTRPLFFLSHWITHPEKDGTYFMQRSFYPGIIHLKWKKVGKTDIVEAYLVG